MAEFADIASYQAAADLTAYAAAGYDRLLVKATEGTTYLNPHYMTWWRLARSLGLACGAYHFARPSRARPGLLAAPDAAHQMGDGYRTFAAAHATREFATVSRVDTRAAEAGGRAEADRFARAVLAAGFEAARDWVCLDAEDPGEQGRPAAAHAVAFCQRMCERGFPRGVVYSYSPYLTGCGLAADMLPPGWRMLHVANYNPAPDSRVPLPLGWGREHVVARQYTSAASQAGIPGRSDASRVVREWLGGRSPEEEIVTEQDKNDIAQRVLDLLGAQIFKAQPPIKQPGEAGIVIGAAYNKIGDAQTAIRQLGEQVGLVGVATHMCRQEVAALNGRVDALATAVGVRPAGQVGLAPPAAETMLAVLLDHLGVEYPPSPATPEPGQE